MLAFLRRRRGAEPPGILCPVCGELQLVSTRGDWRCEACDSRIPGSAYLGFMERMLDLLDGRPRAAHPGIEALKGGPRPADRGTCAASRRP